MKRAQPDAYRSKLTPLQIRRRLFGTLGVLFFIAALVLFSVAIVQQTEIPAELGALLLAPCLASGLACIDWHNF